MFWLHTFWHHSKCSKSQNTSSTSTSLGSQSTHTNQNRKKHSIELISLNPQMLMVTIRKWTASPAFLPQPVEDSAIWVQSDHTVLHCHPMKKGLLVVKEVGVREPQLVCYTVVQSQVQLHLSVGQTLVPPALLEIHCDGVVLGRRKTNSQ